MKMKMKRAFLGIVLVLLTFGFALGMLPAKAEAATRKPIKKTDIKVVKPINRLYDGDYKRPIVIYKKGVTGKTIQRKFKALRGTLTNGKPLNVGKYRVYYTIKGTKKYKGKIKVQKEFTINPRNIQKTDATITLPDSFYDGSTKEITVTFNGVTGIPEISYMGNNLVNGKPVNPGIYTARVTLRGTGNCTGTVTLDEVQFSIVLKPVNTSVVDTFVNSLVPSDYLNWEDFMKVVSSVKAETLQSGFDARVAEVTGFALQRKEVNTSAVDTFVDGLVSTNYSNWEDFMKVVSSVKAETLQSRFNARVAEVTGFALQGKEVNTSAVDTFVDGLVSTDYANWEDFMKVVSSVKAETLQSGFDARVAEVTGFALQRKEVNTSAVDTFVDGLVSTDYSNWEDFMKVVSSVKAETLQSRFNARVAEVTGFALQGKEVNTSAVDTFVDGLVSTDYANWEYFMEVLSSVKAETLQSGFDARVAEVTGFALQRKEVNTSAVDTFVDGLVSTDYSNWEDFMKVVSSVKAEKLQSGFDARVAEVTGFALQRKEVNTSAVDTFVDGLVPTNYTNWEDFMKVVSSVKAEKLQSGFDARVAEVTGFALQRKEVNTSAVDTFVDELVSTDYTNWEDFMKVVSSVKAEKLQSEFDARVAEVTGFALQRKEVDTSAVDTFVDGLVSTDYTNWEDFMKVVDSVKAETLQSEFDARVAEVTDFELMKKAEIKASDATIQFPSNLVYNGEAKEVKVTLKEGVTAEIEIKYTGDGLDLEGKPQNAGLYKVEITLNGIGDYRGTVVLGELQFTILKAKYDVSKIRFSDKIFEYNPLMKYSIFVENSPVEVVYEGNEQSEKGSHIVVAHFIVDEVNYEPIEDMEAYIIIKETDDPDNAGQEKPDESGGDDIEEGGQKPPAED